MGLRQKVRDKVYEPVQKLADLVFLAIGMAFLAIAVALWGSK